MQLLCPVVNIHQQQVVQQQVLDEVVLIEPLLVGHQQILDLESGDLAYHVDIVIVPVGQQHIFQLLLIIHLEKQVALDHLAVRR